MYLENSFDVPARPEEAWDLLMDVPRVIPCMPGAELTETVDESTWKAPHGREARADGAHASPPTCTARRPTARRCAPRSRRRARDVRGRCDGRARIESTLAPHDGGTRVSIKTDLTLSGAVAQMGRGLVVAVSAQLVQSFADCLKAQLAGSQAEAAAAVAAQAGPVAGHSLALRALWERMLRLSSAVFSRRTRT